MIRKTTLRKDQKGLVSFMVVMFIMFVVSLIVLAFARMVRRDQVQTLDRQLNTQAFYAAESGVNDALNALNNDPSLANGAYNNCEDFINAAGLNSDLGNGISYSCLLVDPSPKRLDYPDIPTSAASVAPLRADTGDIIDRIQVYWDDAIAGSGGDVDDCPANTTTAGVYPRTLSGDCEMGTLRLELVPFTTSTNPGGATRDHLLNNKGVVFISPRPTGTTSIAMSSISGDNQGARLNGDCRGGSGRVRRCMLTITGLNIRQGYLRMQSIYRALNVSIEAFSGPTRVGIEGAQAEIDVTGRATDVLKRIKVAAPLPSDSDSDVMPQFALQTRKSQCKRFTWRPGVTTLELSGITTDATQVGYCDPGN